VIVLDLLASMRETHGNVNVDRSGSALERGVNRFLQHIAGVGDVGEQPRLLGRGCEHGMGVGRAIQPRGFVEGSLPAPLKR
jgi:hypothetical protein